jgi:hypothetical protein
MAIGILLELEAQSCKRIYALRRKYDNPAPFVVDALRGLVSTKENFNLLKRALPGIAAKHAPFEMELYDPHRTNSTRGIGVKYRLQSQGLWGLRRDLQAKLADATIFSTVLRREKGAMMSLRQNKVLDPRSFPNRINVSVKTKLADAAEANRILEEVRKIDPKTLGKIRATGLSVQWQRTRDEPFQNEELYPFLRKS